MTDSPDGPENQHRVSRRHFVRTSTLAVGAAATAGACGSTPTDPADLEPPEFGDPPDVVDPTASVFAVTGTHLASMTRQVLDDLGGVGTVVHQGESVFIKPNMVSLPWAPQGNVFAAGECAKPEILIAVAEACLQAGAREVTIGDGSHAPELPWDRAVTLDGSTNLAAEVARLAVQYGRPVRVASLEVDSPEWIEVPSSTYLGPISVSSLVAEADRVISVPVAKTHSWAQLTLSLKNFVGIAPLWRYGDLPNNVPDRGVRFDHSSPAAIAAIYLDIARGVQPDLAVIDFSIGVEGNGPNLSHGGRTVDMRNRLGSYLVLASTDLVAADTVAAWIMSHHPEHVVQLGMAYARGMGEARMERIQVVGGDLRNLRVAWAPAQLRNQPVSARSACPGRAATWRPMVG
jgi:uncharacterized protein (DUF362 family)